MSTKVMIAIHWDKAQLLVVRGQQSGSSLRVDRADMVALNQDASSTLDLSSKLKQLGVTRGEATVVLPRSQVEMRHLTVPPVPVNELPDLVRFQAQSQFASLTDDWALDFVPVVENGHVESVLATALSQKAIDAIKAAIEPAGIKVKHIVVRPFSTVELMRTQAISQSNVLVINEFATDIDLTIAVHGYVNLTRTIRVTPPDEDTASQPGYAEKIVLQEVKRTLAAAMNQTPSVTVDSIAICGNREIHGALAEMLEKETSLKIVFLNPFSAVHLKPAAEKSLPNRLGRFAPLIGSLIQQISSDSHAIDFLNPRRTVKSGEGKRKLILAGVSAAILLLLVSGYLYSAIRAKQNEIARLTAANGELLKSNELIGDLIEEVNLIDEWTRQSVSWLDELKEVSQRFQYPEDVRIAQFDAKFQQNRHSISLRGVARDGVVKSKLDRDLEARPYKLNHGQMNVSPDPNMKVSFNLSAELRAREDAPLFIEDIIRRAKGIDEPQSDEHETTPALQESPDDRDEQSADESDDVQQPAAIDTEVDETDYDDTESHEVDGLEFDDDDPDDEGDFEDSDNLEDDEQASESDEELAAARPRHMLMNEVIYAG
ncbi:MAG TPA: hypothetical protein PKD64_10940 [Pirellulaceae bacterium]|nr:hypothetical protein [Pirellulaceae bacterium]HMO92698.1 hypothetical protein [Pirellulaceae bacterium]HMP70381.1 hypothetical protein [Pirellulaceae bacterium]